MSQSPKYNKKFYLSIIKNNKNKSNRQLKTLWNISFLISRPSKYAQWDEPSTNFVYYYRYLW